MVQKAHTFTIDQMGDRMLNPGEAGTQPRP